MMRRMKKGHKDYAPLVSSPTQNREGILNHVSSDHLDMTEEYESKIEIIEPTFMESVKDYRTIYMWIILIFTSSYPFYIASNFKSYEQRDIQDDRFITLVGSLGAVVNGLSRGVWSTLQDFFGFKKVFLFLLVVEVIVAFTFVAIHKIKALYLIWVLISFSTLGGHFSIFATLCAKIYGPTTGGKMFALIFTAFASATLINWILTKQISKGRIEYETLFYILASMAVVGIVLVFFFNPKTKVRQSIPSASDKKGEGLISTQKVTDEDSS